MNEALLLAAVAFKSYNNQFYIYAKITKSFAWSQIFYMTIDGEHEVAQNFYLKKKRRVVV